MLVLTRKGDKVYYNDVYNNDIELKINAQASKGAGNEVVNIDGLPSSNGQKWVSLSKLQQGTNNITCKARIVSKTTQKYELTPEEAKEVATLQGKIDAIIEVAKARYVAKPNLNVDIASLSDAEKEALIEQVQNYIEMKRA